MPPGERSRLEFRATRDLQSLTTLGNELGSITLGLIRHARDGVLVTCDVKGLDPESWEGASRWFLALGDQVEANRARQIRRSLDALRVRGRPRIVDAQRVLALRNEGNTWRAIATEMRISARSARRALERMPGAHSSLGAEAARDEKGGQP